MTPEEWGELVEAVAALFLLFVFIVMVYLILESTVKDGLLK